jgi:hypothetical protein
MATIDIITNLNSSGRRKSSYCIFLLHTLLCTLYVIYVFHLFFIPKLLVYTVKTGVSFRHSLRHRNSASESVVSTLKSVCLSEKTTLISVKTKLISVKTTLMCENDTFKCENDTSFILSSVRNDTFKCRN